LVPAVKALRSVTGISLTRAVRICRQPLPAVVIHHADPGEAATARLAMEMAGSTISLRASRTAGPGIQGGPPPEIAAP
jgi:ribosomal protein L7/L12